MGYPVIHTTAKMGLFCSSGVSQSAVDTMCRNLGHRRGFKLPPSLLGQPANLPPQFVLQVCEQLNNICDPCFPCQTVECKGDEENVFDCSLSPWGSGGCEDDDILTVICSNVSISEPSLTLNSAPSSSLLSFLPDPSPLRIPSMSLPGLGNIPVCLEEGEGSHEASLLCSSQGQACGLPSAFHAEPVARLVYLFRRHRLNLTRLQGPICGDALCDS